MVGQLWRTLLYHVAAVICYEQQTQGIFDAVKTVTAVAICTTEYSRQLIFGYFQ